MQLLGPTVQWRYRPNLGQPLFQRSLVKSMEESSFFDYLTLYNTNGKLTEMLVK